MRDNYLPWLETFCKTRVSELFEEPSAAITERLNQELRVVKERNLGFYFWIIYTLFEDLAKNQAAFSTRGSSADSFILFLFGLTHYNPMDHDLPMIFFFGTEAEKRKLSFEINLSDEDRRRVFQRFLKCVSSHVIDSEEAQKPLILEIDLQTGALENNEVHVETQGNSEELPERKYKINLINKYWREEEGEGFVIRIYRNSDIDLLCELRKKTGEAAPRNPETDDEIFKYLDIADQRYDPHGLGIMDVPFIRNYFLNIVHPKSCVEISKLLGLSMATDAYIGNQQSLLEDKSISLDEAIAGREDVYSCLISHGFSGEYAYRVIFNIIKKERKIEEEDVQAMIEHGVPQVYVDIIGKIKYLLFSGQMFDYAWQILSLGYYKHYHTKEFEALINHHKEGRN